MTTVSGVLKENYPLHRLTSWRVGGAASLYFRPQDLSDLQSFLKSHHDIGDIFWLGLGSNLLVRDKGLDKCVVHTLNRLVECCFDQQLVYAQAGLPCAKLAKFFIRHGLSGGEFLASIPGTVGGALRMNAGAYGQETWSIVRAVLLMDRQGNLSWHKPEEFTIGYRSVEGMEDRMFVGAKFDLSVSTPEQVKSAIKELLAKRNAAQPIGTFNCGSVFRNPQGDYAARLIESCGLKASKMGGAEVSSKHANFIINSGEATASDIEQLIVYLRQQVFSKTGVSLVRECHVVGNE